MTAVRADDIGQDWLVGPVEADGSSSNAEASAAVLLLLFWRRVQVDDPRVHFSHDAVKGEWELARFAP